MSQILVISDSHGNIAALTTILEWVRSDGLNYQAAVFLGDGYEDLGPASRQAGFVLPWHAVRGNGDYRFSIPDNMTVEISSRKLFLSHGHRYHVREDNATLAAIARNAGAEAALFGHTHVPYCAMEDGIFLLNPGSISRPRSNTGCTFAVLECPGSAPPEGGGPLTARFFTLVNRGGKSIVKDLSLK
jgi:putative phosphoesterase